MKSHGSTVNMKVVEKSLRDEQKECEEFQGTLEDLEKMIREEKIDSENAQKIYDLVSGTFDTSEMTPEEKTRFFSCRRKLRSYL